MKNLKLFFLSITALILMNNCSVNDDEAITSTASTKTVNFTTNSPDSFIRRLAPFTPSIDIAPTGFSNTARINYTINGLATNPTGLAAYKDLTAGTATTTLTLPTTVRGKYSTTLSSLQVVTPKEGETGIIGTKKTLSYYIMGNVTPTVGKTRINLLWNDAYYDFDIYLVTGSSNLSGTVVGYSGGVVNEEEISVSNTTLADGTYSVYVEDYWGDWAGTPIYFVITYADGTRQVLESTVVDDRFQIKLVKAGTSLTFTKI